MSAATTTTTTTDIVHAYRRLLRAGLRAVQFSKPSRMTLTEALREGFRDTRGGRTLEPERVRRTVWFLNAAAQHRGIEHRILKTLCRVRWERAREERRVPWRGLLREEELKRAAKRKLRWVYVFIVILFYFSLFLPLVFGPLLW